MGMGQTPGAPCSADILIAHWTPFLRWLPEPGIIWTPGGVAFGVALGLGDAAARNSIRGGGRDRAETGLFAACAGFRV